MCRRPNFLIIGAPKCGTTSLYNYLGQHPEIEFSHIKEPKFFSFGCQEMNYVGSSYGIEQLEKTTIWNYEDYLNLFKDKSAKYIGEATPNYLHFQVAAKNIYEFDPQIKLIAILRNPAERAFSDWKHNIRMGWEPINNFKRVLKKTEQRMEKNSLPYYDYLNKGLYGYNLSRFYSLFDKSQIKVIFYDDFIGNPSKTCNEILNFLGLDDDFSFNTNHIYMKSTYTPRSKRVFWLTKRIKNYSPFIHAKLSRLNSISEEWDEEANFFLKNYYKNDITHLENLTGRNLSEWKM